ncbi:choline binding protein PcpA [Streptococcus pneumoniae]|nr:choline binding protein PcpA [Streptococcus pneumoniae]VJP91778.1 choline binding protein PcpA [Streptococcus pneumoniae]
MKKTTILSLTTAAVILAAYVPNEPILADTPSSEVIKETKVGSIIQQNNIKYKVLTVEGNIGTVQVGNGVTPVEFEAGQDGKPFTIPTKITVGDKVFTVTEVASQAFSYYPDETGRIVYYPSSITIPSSIKKIQKKGFHGSKAKTIIFDKGSQLEKIEDRAFDFSELEEIELPASLEYIGTSAFSFSQKLKKLTFSSSSKLELISHEAFANLSNLEKLTLPKSVKTLGSNLFRLTTSLKHVDVEEGNESFASVDGVLFSKDKTQLIYYPSQKNDESYKTPKETKELASYSFNKNSYLKKLELNEGLEKIGTFAFADAIKLEEISLPKLKSLTIGNNINSLPSFFLSGVLDSLKEIHIKNKSTEFSVKKDTFAIPETVKFYVTSEHIKDVLKSNLSTSNDIIVEKVDNIKQETDVAKPKKNSNQGVVGWVKDKGLWYYLNESGSMATGWFTVSGKWYYTYNSGDLLVNTTTPDGYRVNANGEWVG